MGLVNIKLLRAQLGSVNFIEVMLRVSIFLKCLPSGSNSRREGEGTPFGKHFNEHRSPQHH